MHLPRSTLDIAHLVTSVYNSDDPTECECGLFLHVLLLLTELFGIVTEEEEDGLVVTM